MPSESAVRAELRRWLEVRVSTDSTIVEEFWVPARNERADLALLGERLEGYEIKTSRDNLNRLPRQAEAYGRVFDRCTAVVAPRHLEGVEELLPQWWGVVLIHNREGTPKLESMRSAGANPALDDQTLVRLLWKSEAQEALEVIGVAAEPGASRFRLWEMLLDAASAPRLRELVREALVVRDPTSARIPSKRFAVTIRAADH